jgi:hypothetical protein
MISLLEDPSAVPGAGAEGDCGVERTTHLSDNSATDVAQQDHESVGPRPTDSDETVRIGKEAWQRLIRTHNGLFDWIAVGRAHEIGRADAMREAGVNRPHGHRYKKAFGAWLKRPGFHNMDKGDRARLFLVMDNLAAIEQWRTGLGLTEQMRLNHPSSVWRKWQVSTKSPAATAGERKPSPTEKMQQSIAALEEENHRLKREVETGGGDLWNESDRPEDIAAAIHGKLMFMPLKLDRVISALNKLAKKRLDQSAPAPRKKGGVR